MNAAADALPISEPGSPMPNEITLPSSTPTTPHPADMLLPDPQPSPPRIIGTEALRRLRQQQALSGPGSESSSNSSSEKETSTSFTTLTFAPTTSDASAGKPEIELLRLSELVPQEALAQCSTINGDWTLADFINYVIDNDVVLPNEDQMYGCPTRNAAEVEAHAGQVDHQVSSAGLECEIAACRREDPDQGCGNDLSYIGVPLYYEDSVTGKIRRRRGRFNPMDPRHPATVDTATEQDLEGEKSEVEGIG
ncbi:MAG: hypothetical protein Q9222_000560 [Ikaeria aurantiellina]